MYRTKQLLWILPALLFVCSIAAQCATPIYWVVSDMTRVGRTDAAQTAHDIELYAARGEYAAFQVVVRGPAGGLSNVNLSVSALSDGNGNVLPNTDFTLYREAYVQVTQPTPDRLRSTVKSLGAGWYADPLIPFIDPSTGLPPPSTARFKAANAAVAEGQNQPYWIDIFVPRDTNAGNYTGSYAITSAQGSVSGQITLHVRGFTLPLKPSEGSIFVAWKDGSVQALREAVKHKIMPSGVSSAVAPGLMSDYGLSSVDMGFFSGADVSNHTMSPAPTVQQFQAKANQYDNALRKINYTADEIADPSSFATSLKQWAVNMHQAGVQQLLVGPPVPSLFDDGSGTGKPGVDIWVVASYYYYMSPTNVNTALTAGDMSVWSYTTLNQDDYSPKWQLDFAPINYRAIQGFMNQSMGLSGILYWALDNWQTSDPWTDVSFYAGGSNFPGNSFLVYPGADVGIAGTVPCLRMKWIRKGIEDYEYVELLKKANPTLAKTLSQTVATDWKTWSTNPVVYENAREVLAEQIPPTAPETPSAVVADSQSDFLAINQTPPVGQGHGGWTYLSYTSPSPSSYSSTTQMDQVNDWSQPGTPWWYLTGDNFYDAIGKTLMRGQTYWTRCPCRRWTSTVNGNIRIAGTFSKAAVTSYSKRFMINANGVTKYAITLAASDTASHDYSITVPAAVGDKIDFVYDAGSTGLESTGAKTEGQMTAQITSLGIPIDVNVTLSDYSGDLSILPIKVELLESGIVVGTQLVTPTALTQQVEFDAKNPGTYTVRASAAGFLRQAADVTAGINGASVNLTLPSGDIDGDNEVTSTDVSIAIKNLGQTGH